MFEVNNLEFLSEKTGDLGKFQTYATNLRTVLGNKRAGEFQKYYYDSFYFYFINFASQAGRAPQQLAPITVAPFLPSQP